MDCVSTVVLQEPCQCSLFWDYIQESAFSATWMNLILKKLPDCHSLRVHAVGPARLIPMRSNRKTALWLYDMISIHQRSARTNECKITLISSDCVMNDFTMSGIMFMTVTPLDSSPHSLDVWWCHSLVPWWSPWNPASENSPEWIIELSSVMDTWLI